MSRLQHKLPSEEALKFHLYESESWLQVGQYRIKWEYISHHLAWKRYSAIDYHGLKRYNLSKVQTSDIPHNLDFKTSDKVFEVMCKRLLPKKCLIWQKCMGCGESGAPTTDNNNAAAWHGDCWKKALGDNLPYSANGYVKHLETELKPRILKWFPKLELNVYRQLFETCEDLFMIRMFDINTKAKHQKARRTDKRLTYNGFLADFKLENMVQNKEYYDYVVMMMDNKHKWHSKNIKLSQLTYEYFCNFYVKPKE